MTSGGGRIGRASYSITKMYRWNFHSRFEIAFVRIKIALQQMTAEHEQPKNTQLNFTSK